MGSKTKTTNEPWQPAQGAILAGLNNSVRVFDQTQPALEGFAGDQRSTYGRVAPGAEQGIGGAQNFVNRALSGRMNGRNPGQAAYMGAMTPRQTNNYGGAVQPSLDYYRKTMAGGFMGGNPYLDSSIGYAIDDANDAANSQFSRAGRYGSGAHQSVLAREAGRISSNARMGAYEAERGRMGEAAGAYGGLNLQAMGADENARAGAQSDALRAAAMADQGYDNDRQQQQWATGSAQDLMRGSQSILDSAADLPWRGIQALSGAVRQNSAGYGTQTQTQSGAGAVMDGISKGIGLAGQIGGAALAFSEPGMKKNVKPIGKRPDGLGVYEFQYKDGTGLGAGPQVGVMADEVQAMRPDALGPQIGGARTVDYGKLFNPGSADYRTPGIGDGIRDGMPLAPSQSIALQPEQLKRKKLGLFGSLADDPTLSKPENAKRALGLRMLAASGNPLGVGAMGMVDNAQQRQLQQQRLDVDRQQADGLAAYRTAMLAGKGDTPQATAFQREFEYFNSLTPEQQRAAMALRRAPVATSDGFVNPMDAPGKQPYRAPRRAASGGAAPGKPGMSGGVPVITSPQQFAALPSGATFKAPDGTIRRKP